MNNWLSNYQKAWKTVQVDNIDERLSKIWDSIKEDQKKNRRSTFFMSLAFAAAIAVILWVAFSNNFDTLTSWFTVIGMIGLMVLTTFLRIKAFAATPDPLKTEKEHIDKVISSYNLRLKMQRQYLWFYVVVLNLLLITFYIDSYYPEELNVLIWATLITVGYSLLVVFLMNKKRKEDIEYMTDVIQELKSLRQSLNE